MPAMMGMFEAMTNKMTEAFERISASTAAPQQINVVADAGLSAQIAEKDAEIRRLREEMERLKQSMAQGDDSEPKLGDDLDFEIDWDTEEGSADEQEIDRSTRKTSADEPDAEIDWGEEDADDTPSFEIDWNAEETFDADESSEETDWSEKPGEGESDEEGSGEGESDEASAEDDDDDVFDLSAFLTRSVEHAQSLTFVDRMRREGQETAEISLEELMEFLEKRKQQAREIA